MKKSLFMVRVKILIALIGLFQINALSAQTDRGKIIKPASSVLDPNGDGFVSKTAAGFSFDGYYVDEFETKMFGIPQLTGDVTGDNIGKTCGITDLIPDTKGFSVYAVRDASNNLIFRFRVGDNNPSVEAWTILLDTDGLFGANDPNATVENPGFEVDITFIKNNNKGILVYNLDGIESCPTPVLTYPFSTHFQIAIADEVSCGDPDYFYDFYVPFSQIAAAFGINENTGLRYAAVVNVSATCAMAGKIADISGVDYNEYQDCVPCAFEALVNNQCPTAVVDLCETCSGFEKDKVSKPKIYEPLRAGQTEILGATVEPNIFIQVEVYPNIGTPQSPNWSTNPNDAREIKTTYSIDTSWSIMLTNPLQGYDRIVARAKKTENSVPCAGAGGNDASSTSITVVQPNDRPIANDQLVSVNEDASIAITLTGSDPDNDPLTYTLVSSPSNGTLTGTPPNVTYTPAANFNGSDSFTFQVSDGIFLANVPGVVTINVLPVNDIPVANNQTVLVIEDTPKAITLTGSDIDGDPLTYIIQNPPTNGTLTGTAPNLTYTPSLNYYGADSFTFLVNDGSANSNIATVTINVSPVNDAPVANNQSVTVTEDVAKVIALVASDVDGNPLTYTIVSAPSNGVLSGSGANRTYTPAANYNGPDSFTFKVNDGTTDSNIATVSITVTPVNDAPIANNQSVTVTEDVAKAITLTGSDVDGDVLTYIIQNAPLHGVLSGTGANLTYTPAADYNGSDSFTFIANDGTVNSNVATVFITVTPVNDPPVANNQSVTTAEDTPILIVLVGNDPDGDAITYIVVAGPTNGTLSGTAPNITYTPNLNFNGSDSFTFKVNDGGVDSNIATVSITVTPDNDPPVADNQNATYDFNTPQGLTLTGSDPDGDILSFTVVDQPTNGVLSGTEPNLTYTPNNGFTGTDTFTFIVNDGTVDSDLATVTLTMTPIVNSAPVANNSSVTVTEDIPRSITLSATDVDGNPLTYAIISPPSNGSISGGTGSTRTYTPASNYFGSDSFTFQVTDSYGAASNVATVSITVTPVNDIPIANSQSVTTAEDTQKAITLTGSDVEDASVTFAIVTQPQHGTLTGSAPNITYTPAQDYFGADSFTFRVSDSEGAQSSIATVSITVTPINDAPVANNDITEVTDEDTPVSFSVIGNDVDIDGNVVASSVDLDPTSPAEDKSITIPGEGTYTVNASGMVTFVPELNFNGVTTPISYTVKDNQGALSNEGEITITVNPVNDAPVPQDATVAVNEDESVDICVIVTDVEGDPAVISQADAINNNGTLNLSNSGGALCFTYTPNPDYFGQDIVIVVVCDENDPTLCNTATITINVIPQNDPPIVIVDGEPKDDLVYTTPEDVTLDFCFKAEDIDGDIAQVDSYTNVSGGGTLNLISGVSNEFCFQFIPIPNFNGQSIWTASICDPGGLCDNITITINVTPVNDAPVADPQSVTVVEDTSKDFVLTGSDIDGDALTYHVVGNPSNGTIVQNGASIRYTPNLNYFGLDSIKFVVNDGKVNSTAAKVSITVTPVNDPPTVDPLSLIAKEDSVLQVCLRVTDVDGDNVTFSQPVNLTGGGVMNLDPNLNFCYIFTPDQNYNGFSVWEMKVCDDSGLCGTSIVEILVNPVNDPPVAVDDYVSVLGGVETMIDVLSNDLVIEDPFDEFYDIFVTRDSTDYLEIFKVKSFNGTATIVDGEVAYTPNFEFMGTDSVKYWIRDKGGLIDSALVYIEVGPAKFRIFEAISPNGDNLNDYWRINGIEQDPGNRVRLFDRFNNLVYEIVGYSNEDEAKRWSGQSNHGLVKGNLPEGTYYYTIAINLTEDNQGERLFSGYVILKRN